METTIITKIEQGRAAFAYKCASDVAQDQKLKKDEKKEYKQYSKKLITMIKTNGLAPTLAFILSKSGTYEKLGNDISAWLKKSNLFSDKFANLHTTVDLIKHLINNTGSVEYNLITTEVLNFLVWLKRFNEGLIDE
ncbi:type III-B CRISPR module-associated protein Cmr5 [Melioribacter sp. OK-6-Me]|uniref:type III-B CRISPR module-associated protein Cmr5 n=1 Tax=unclassified Melioribacter TaxID=2627329 RepID=UPI003ED8F59F